MSPEIGINIRKLRKEKNLTQKELASRINKSNGYLSDIENGNKLPSINVLYSIAYHLGACPSSLLSCTKVKCQYCIKKHNK